MSDIQKPDNQDPVLDAMEPILEVVPTLRGRFFEIFLSLGVAIYLIYLLKQIPPYGMWLDQLIGLKIKFLHIKLSYATLAWPLKIIASLASFYAFFVFLQQKLTKYKLTDLFIERTHGVINRASDSTDLVSIKDQRLSRTLLDRVLGISRLLIISKDVTDPEMMIKGISSSDAQKIINFLRKYAFQNYTEWRIHKEKQNEKQARKRKNPDLTGFEDDGDE